MRGEQAALTVKFEAHYAGRINEQSVSRHHNPHVFLMTSDPVTEFRRLVSRRAHQFPKQWEASKQLLDQTSFPATVERLVHTIKEHDLPVPVRELLRHIFEHQPPQRIQDLNGSELKTVTGLPPTKALRALCIFFDLVPVPSSRWSQTRMSSEEIERQVRQLANPFDLLRSADVASVLDIGSGDLSFAEELADQYGPVLHQRNQPFILHSLDRLDPRSQLGGPLHADHRRLDTLQHRQGLTFAFFGNQDMFHLDDLEQQDVLATRYTVVTCWAPASPTFAYEPSRLAPAVIQHELERTKGSFHLTRYGKETALEVQHGERALLFPPWKFDIVGPRALLDLLARRGALCLLGAVDNHVFWEILAQLLDDERYRPQDQPFHAANLPQIFGKIYEVLTSLPMGGSIDLADLGMLRRPDTSLLPATTGGAPEGIFRYVRISRGATFPGMPASSTARKFSAMTEEVPPWFLTLVPARDTGQLPDSLRTRMMAETQE